MCYVPYVLLTVTYLSQATQPSQGTSLPPASGATPPAANAPANPAAQAQAEPTPETEVDKFLRECADKIDKIPNVSGEIRQTIRLANRMISSSGKYQNGPGYKLRFELNVDLGDAVGTRIQICNGKLGYRYEKLLETESLQSFDVEAIMALLKTKELPDQAREQIQSFIPYIQPGDMLRGYLRTLTFTEKEEGTLGEENKRPVTIVTGHWKKELVQQITGGQQQVDIAELGQSMPQYARVYLDKETCWPLRVELYRQDKEAEYKPIFVLEFLQVEFSETLPESAFAFKIPKGVVPQDVTPSLLTSLKGLPDKKEGSISEKQASQPSTNVSPVIKPAGKQETDKKE